MKKKSIVLSAQELQTKLKEKYISKKIKDSDIKYLDIPEQSAAKLSKFKRVGRPLVGEAYRKAISVRIDEKVLIKLKDKAIKKGIGYQSLINQILKKAV